MQSLGMQPAAKTAVREQMGAAERPSFRSSMERAEQEAAQAAKKPEASAEEQAAEQPEDARIEEGLTQAVEEAAGAAVAETKDAEAEEGAMEELLSMLGGEEDAEEDALQQSDIQIGELAAALMQPVADSEAKATEGQTEQIETAPVQEGQASLKDQILAAVKQTAQEGEKQPEPGTVKEQAANINIGNTIADAVKPAATKAQGRGRIQENYIQQQDLTEGGRIDAQQTFAPAWQPAAVIDLAAADGAPLPAPEMAGALQENIFDQIQTAVNTGKQELFIQLKPENLGGLAIQLTMTEEGIKAQVRTGSENIQNIVNSQIVQLEEALKARDIPVVQMEVILDQSANNNFLGQQRQAWQGHGGGTGRGAVMAVDEPASLYEAVLMAAPDMAEGLADGVEFTA